MEKNITSTTENSIKPLFISIGDGKKLKVTLNQYYQFNLLSNISRMIEYSYNQEILLFSLEELQNYLNSPENSLQNAPDQSLENYIQKIEATIEEVKNKLKFLEYQKTRLDSDLDDGEKMEFRTFTEVPTELKESIEKQAALVQRKSKLNAEIFYLELYLEKLGERRRLVLEEFTQKTFKIFEDLRQLKVKVIAKYQIISQMKNTNIIQFITYGEKYCNDLEIQFLDSVRDFELLSTLYSHKTTLELKLNKDDDYKKIIEELQIKHSMIEIEKCIEPFYLNDLDNLEKKKKILENEIDLYSPQWLMKQYEKNLNILLNNLNSIIEKLQSTQINNYASHFNITHTKNPKLRNLTIENYKMSLMKDQTQKLIFNLLKTSNINLEKLSSAVNNMKNVMLNINLPSVYFQPITFYIESDIDEKYKILLDKIQYINDSIQEVYQNYNNMMIYALDGIVSLGDYKMKSEIEGLPSRTFYLVETSSVTTGMVFSCLIKPSCRTYHFSNNLFFLYHENFKKTRESLNALNNQILMLSKRNEIILSLEKEIKLLSSNLLEENLDVLSVISQKLTSEIRKKFLSISLLNYTTFSNMTIKKSDMIYVFGSFLKNINLVNEKQLQKNKKNHEKVQMTVKQFFQCFFSALFNTEIDRNPTVETIKEWVRTLVPVSIERISKFLVSEQLFGSILADDLQPQRIHNGKVLENCYMTLQSICSDVSYVLFSSIKGLKPDSNENPRLNELRNIFFERIKILEPKLIGVHILF